MAANLTLWNASDTVTFLIHNETLTDLYVWMNSTEPETVYLDTVNSSSAWSYAASILKINATDNTNVTISWVAAPPAPGVANITGLVIIGAMVGIPMLLIWRRKRK